MFWYSLALLLFALGLMSKPMLVTLPFVLLLLDLWPLNRTEFSIRHWRNLMRLCREKIPFFVLSGAASVITFIVQQESGAVSSLQGIPLGLRFGNAMISYGRYIMKTLCPAELSIIYPYPEYVSWLPLVAALLLLAAVSWLAVRHVKALPWLAAGWFWYLGTLVPVIGLVQVGAQSMADRYTYIPSIGLFVVIVWGTAHGVEAISARLTRVRFATALAGGAVLIACAAATAWQVQYWRTGEALFRHALAVTPNNYAAEDGLATALCLSGKIDEGITHYFNSIRLAPTFPPAHFNLGTILMNRGRNAEAIEHLQTAVSLDPNSADAQHNLGTALFKAGKLDEARTRLLASLRLKPDDADTHHTLGIILLNQSKAPEAASEFIEALRLNPRHSEAHRNLAVALVQLGHLAEALPHFEKAVQFSPQDPELRFNLGLALLDSNRPDEAAAQFREAIRLNPNDPKNHYRLAIANRRQNRVAEAIVEYRATLRLYPDFPEALNDLAWLLATDPDPKLRAGAEAVTLAEQACSMTKSPQSDMVLTLSAAYAEAGRFEQAAATAQKALELAQAGRDAKTVAMAEELARTFKNGRAYRQGSDAAVAAQRQRSPESASGVVDP